MNTVQSPDIPFRVVLQMSGLKSWLILVDGAVICVCAFPNSGVFHDKKKPYAPCRMEYLHIHVP